MAKTHSKSEARSRKVKATSKSSKSNTRSKVNQSSSNLKGSEKPKEHEPMVDKCQVFGWVIPDDFILSDPKRQNVFIGESAQDTLENVRAGLALIQSLVCGDESDVTLSSDSKHGLSLVIDNLMWALYIERELERGSV